MQQRCVCSLTAYLQHRPDTCAPTQTAQGLQRRGWTSSIAPAAHSPGAFSSSWGNTGVAAQVGEDSSLRGCMGCIAGPGCLVRPRCPAGFVDLRTGWISHCIHLREGGLCCGSGGSGPLQQELLTEADSTAVCSGKGCGSGLQQLCRSERCGDGRRCGQQRSPGPTARSRGSIQWASLAAERAGQQQQQQPEARACGAACAAWAGGRSCGSGPHSSQRQRQQHWPVQPERSLVTHAAPPVVGRGCDAPACQRGRTR